MSMKNENGMRKSETELLIWSQYYYDSGVEKIEKEESLPGRHTIHHRSSNSFEKIKDTEGRGAQGKVHFLLERSV